MGAQTSRPKQNGEGVDTESIEPNNRQCPQLNGNDCPMRGGSTKSTILHKFGRVLSPCSIKANKSPNGKPEREEVDTAIVIRRRQQRELEESRPFPTEQQTAIVQRTWHILYQDLGQIGCDMFVRMFESYPGLRQAFATFKSLKTEDERYLNELRNHGKRLLATIASVLEKQNDPDAMISHLHELGQKHMTFDAKMAYMDVIAAQFLFAIEPVLGEAWTPEVEEAWAAQFKLIMHVMREKMVF